MIVLLPPSEGKAPGGRGRWRPECGDFGALADQRRAVIDAMQRVPLADRSKVFGATGELADRALAACHALGDSDAPALPAWQRFTGVVWEHLAPATLPAAARRRIVVPSAVLGLCRGTDPTPDFRAKLSVSLPGIGRLDRWWRASLTSALARTRGPIVDLLPNEHAAAFDLEALARRVTRVSFVDARGAAVGHNAKAAKGRLARAVLLGGIDALDDFVCVDAWQEWRAERCGAHVVVRAE